MPVNIYNEILEWSSARPAWQRDALRRIVANGDLSEADLEELQHLCREPHDALEATVSSLSADGTSSDTALASDPLHAKHLPTTTTAKVSVSLVKLGSLTHVNRLSQQTAISFGSSPGLTIVYGNNGAGKSGYARVIRKACRTRGLAAKIEPNAWVNTPPLPATAQFILSVNGQPTPVTWKDGQAGDPHLGRILFFDGICAEHYVQEDGGTSFIPKGLDVLTKLTSACDHVRDCIIKRVQELRTLNRTASASWKLHDGTKVATFINALSAISDQNKIASLANWTTAAEARLESIRVQLASDPQQKSQQTRASAKRIKDLGSALQSTTAKLSEAALQTLLQARSERDVAAQTHQIASAQTFGEDFLPGTGGEVWRQLWIAASNYSIQQAYPEHEFPYTKADARCVLCQTPYDTSATDRMNRFSAHIANETLRALQQKNTALSTIRAELEQLPDLARALETASSDLQANDAALLDAATPSVEALQTRLSNFLAAAKETTAVPDTFALPVALDDKFSSLYDQLTQQANNEAALHDPTARQTLQKERAELEDRLWLSNNETTVLEQIERLKAIARLEAAQNDTGTAPVTTKASHLNKAIVTQALCDAFADEIVQLGLTTIQVELRSAGGQKGTSKFGVRLPGIASNMVSKIASEGEKRCIAFALFMAELSQSDDRSALVLDDPVSSLDHLHSESMARRIAKEALTRQVVVFTHHPLFLHELQSSAADLAVTIDLGYLQWNGQNPGDWVAGLPWDWKTVADRLDTLRKKADALAGSVSVQLSEDDKAEIRQTYSRLRGTLERIVETKIFAGSVQRFSNYVNIKSVEKVVGFPQTEFDELKRIFDACSDVTEAHDTSSGSNKPVPGPDQLKKDIEATRQLVETINLRQNKKS